MPRSAPTLFPAPQVDKSGKIGVPVFADFKRHVMGQALADPVDQPVDRSLFDVDPVPAAEFLTRPPWGVADTGPWLHDGRAQTLAEAIELHGVDAKPSVDAFLALDDAGRAAVIDFLLELRLPLNPDFQSTLK